MFRENLVAITSHVRTTTVLSRVRTDVSAQIRDDSYAVFPSSDPVRMSHQHPVRDSTLTLVSGSTTDGADITGFWWWALRSAVRD